MATFIKPEFKNTVSETTTATNTAAEMLNLANAMKETGAFHEDIMRAMISHASTSSRVVGPKAGIEFSAIPFGGIVLMHNDRNHTIRIMVTTFGVVIMEKKDGWSRIIRNGDLDVFSSALMKFIGH